MSKNDQSSLNSEEEAFVPQGSDLLSRPEVGGDAFGDEVGSAAVNDPDDPWGMPEHSDTGTDTLDAGGNGGFDPDTGGDFNDPNAGGEFDDTDGGGNGNGFGDDMDADPEPGPSEGKKNSKVGAYTVVGGICLVVFSLIGAGLALKSSQRSDPAQSAAVQDIPVAAPMATPPVAAVAPPSPVAAPVVAQITKPVTPPTAIQVEVQKPIFAAVDPVGGHSTYEVVPPKSVAYEPPKPSSSAFQQVLPAQRTSSPEVELDATGSKAIADLGAKTDMLAKAFLKFQDGQALAEKAVDEGELRTRAQLDDHGTRLAEMEVALKEIRDLVANSSRRAPAKPVASKPAAPASATAKAPAKVAEATSAPQSKLTVRTVPVAAKPVATPARTAAAAPASSVAGYSVVATYPSTTQPDMQPLRAWVTNGEKLVELSIGASINGARVQSIKGTTVYTSAGEIRPVK